MNNGREPEDHEELVGDNHHNDGDPLHKGTVATLQFPIRQPNGKYTMKNISPSVLPCFHKKAVEDLDEFLFKFDILCRSYDYTSNEQKLNIFLATLKDNALRWFMILGGDSSPTQAHEPTQCIILQSSREKFQCLLTGDVIIAATEDVKLEKEFIRILCCFSMKMR